MIKACVFDLDGTLLNTLPTIRYYVNETIAELGLDGITEDECCSFIGHGAYHLIDSTLRSKNLCDPELTVRTLKSYNSRYDADTLYLTEPYDGITNMVDALYGAGIKLAVLSNKPDATTADIISKFFPGHFSVVRGGRDGIPLKPAPDALISIIDELGILPCEVMYIGDTGVDIATGKNANVYKTVGVCWGFRSVCELQSAGADVLVHAPSEITEEAVKNA